MDGSEQERSNGELVEQIRRHVRRLRHRSAEDLDREDLLALLALLERLNAAYDSSDGDPLVGNWSELRERQGLGPVPGRCALSDDGYHRYLDGVCMYCGEPVL